jgi:alpha-L-fucosidase
MSDSKIRDDFGIIFHWGVYSVFAYDDPISARRRKIQNGSEWAKKRLEETGKFRPVSGWEQTQAYAKKTMGGLSYTDMASKFTCEKWDVDEWMTLCKSVGAQYVILTAKHHDGFCLWNTATTDFNSCKTGPKKDLIKEFGLSAEKHGLSFGLYYSWYEFDKGCTIPYMKMVEVQIKELLTYNPDIIWFDGDWICKTKYAVNKISEICTLLRSKSIIINDRIADNSNSDPNYLGKASYRVYADRFIPTTKPSVPFQHINTVGISWGRNTAQEKKDYKTGEDLFKLYTKVNAMGGKFLLNLGPSSDGTLDPDEVDSLVCFGKQLFIQ